MFPFLLEREHLGTIDGDMEAFYAVVSANYLEGRIDASLRSTFHHAGEIGALDMGTTALSPSLSVPIASVLLF